VGFRAFASQANSFKNLTAIGFDNNKMGDDGLKAFSQ